MRAAALVAFGHEKIAELRRAELAKRPTNVVTGTIREWVRKLIRSELISELTTVRTDHPELQVAYRECDQMTDDDLRSALEDALSLIERQA